MKPTMLLIFVILLSSKLLFAQDNFIGLTKQSADSIMIAKQSVFSNTTTTTDTKLPIEIFKNKDGSMTLVYYDKNNVCNELAVTYKTADIEAIKDILKREFNQQADKQWVRKDSKVKAEVLILKGMIVVKYSKI